MRVLGVSNLYPPHALGGYEWSAHDVLRRFHERGHDVEVLTTTTRFDGVPHGEVAPFPVHRILDWYWDDHELLSPGVLSRLAVERRNQRALRRVLDRHRPDVVSVWNVGAMSQGLLHAVAGRGLPVVYAVCDEWPVHGRAMDAWARLFEQRPGLGRIAEVLLRVPSRPVDLGPTGAWCFVSDHTREACRAGAPFTFPRSAVVHSGIEAAEFPLAQEEDRPFRWRLLYVGRLDVRKGVLTAVDALALLPDEATLTLVGRGDAEAEVRSRAAALGLAHRVHVTAADRSELAGTYRDADVFLFTSEWDEPFGLTPVEAMACGTPVVGTGTGGSGEFLIDGVTCLRCAPADPAALAGAVRRVAADPELRARLRAGGRRVAAELTTDRLADVLEAWHLAAADRFVGGQPADRPLLPAAFGGA